jgi:hypothetical protein
MKRDSKINVDGTQCEFLFRHSRMLLAGIQANSDWTPDKNIRG